MIRFIIQTYKNRGGTERFNNVFLTGGGASIIEDVIRKALTKAGRENGRGIYLAGDRVSPIFTNAYGASKLASFYSRRGRI
jgi:hypothetical protein